MLRSVLAVLAGVILGSLIVFMCESAGHRLWPIKGGVDVHNPAQLRNLVAATPFGAKLAVVFGWFAGTFTGAALALVIARRWAPVAWVVAMTFFGLTVSNFAAIPHPVWMQLAAVVTCASAGALAVKALRGRYGPPPVAQKSAPL